MVDDEWDSFLSVQNECGFSSSKTSFIENNNIVDEISGDVPECQDLYISTTTKVLFLNQIIDIQTIYWKIPITDYWKPESGVIKKQIKIVSKTQEELDAYYCKLESINYYNEVIIKQLINQDARRIKFKD